MQWYLREEKNAIAAFSKNMISTILQFIKKLTLSADEIDLVQLHLKEEKNATAAFSKNTISAILQVPRPFPQSEINRRITGAECASCSVIR